MIAGHFGFAAAVKSREMATPLWGFMLASVWLDIAFIPFLATGTEYIEKVPGAGPYGGAIIHADYTHSLVGAVIISAMLGLPAAWAWGRRSGLMIGLVSFSHWLLDLVVHRGDMPLLPGNAGHLPKLGAGLWQLPTAAAGVELVLVIAGAFLYWRAADSVARAAGRGMRLAAANGLLILAFGAVVLAMDVTGAGGG
jgi:hypothetical protein